MREIYIEFVIYGNGLINHKELTEIIGITPTNETTINELIRKNINAIDSSWIYQTDRINTFFVDDVVEHIYELINPRISTIIDYLKLNSLECKFNIVIHTPSKDSFPSLYFKKEFISICSFLNASIDTDVYIS